MAIFQTSAPREQTRECGSRDNLINIAYKLRTHRRRQKHADDAALGAAVCAVLVRVRLLTFG